MILVPIENTKSLNEQATPFLIKDEIDNNLLLAMLPKEESETQFWAAALQSDDGSPLGYALQKQKMPLLLSQISKEATQMVANWICDNKIPIHGVCAKSQVAKNYCDAYSKLKSVRAELEFELNVYRLEHVNEALLKTNLSFQLASGDDLPYLVRSIDDFYVETGASQHQSSLKIAQGMLDTNALYLLKDNLAPLSMAGIVGQTPNGKRIAYVYTPKEFRGKNYGSVCVAHLCQEILKGKKKFVFLFANKDHIAPNRLYQKVGFEKMEQFISYKIKEL